MNYPHELFGMRSCREEFGAPFYRNLRGSIFAFNNRSRAEVVLSGIIEASCRWEIYGIAKQVADICEFPDAIRLEECASEPLRLADYKERTFIEPRIIDASADELIINPAWSDAKWTLRFAYRGSIPPRIGYAYDEKNLRLMASVSTNGAEFLYDVVRVS